MRFDSGDSGHLPNKVGRVGGRAIFFWFDWDLGSGKLT